MRFNQLGNNKAEIVTNKVTLLFSYNTCVAANIDGKYIKTSTKHSRTTSKHISQWLNGANAELKDQSYFDNITLALHLD